MIRRAAPLRPNARLTVSLLATLAALAAMILPASALTAQAASAPQARPERAPWSSAWQPPRTPEGHPELQGNWTNVTLTPFQRPEGREPVFTWDEVAEIERPDDECPPNPGTVVCGRASAAGTTNEARLSGNEYNEVYWDRGSHVAIVNGEPRTSLITWPANGRRPPITPAAQRRAEEARNLRAQFAQYDHPELRPLGERCVVSFGTSAGPPMIPNSAYNNNYTIVQTADHILIMAEMVHDTRVIRLGERRPLPPQVRPWFGDSWGSWEGNTLVVETTNLNPAHPFQGVTPTERTKVIERFTRVDEDTILYEFTVDDPDNYTEIWGGEIPLERFDDLLYEYACHEGNYALEGVLRGARYEESLATSGGRD